MVLCCLYMFFYGFIFVLYGFIWAGPQVDAAVRHVDAEGPHLDAEAPHLDAEGRIAMLKGRLLKAFPGPRGRPDFKNAPQKIPGQIAFRYPASNRF